MNMLLFSLVTAKFQNLEFNLTGIGTVLSIIISAINIGVVIYNSRQTQKISKKNLDLTKKIHDVDMAKKNDQESNWVDALVRVMETDDASFGQSEVLTVRRSLRAFPKMYDGMEKNYNTFGGKWDEFSNLSIEFTELCSELYYGYGAKIPHEVINTVRNIARTNFANHWEYNELQGIDNNRLSEYQEAKLRTFFEMVKKSISECLNDREIHSFVNHNCQSYPNLNSLILSQESTKAPD